MLRVARSFDELLTAGKSPELALARMRASHVDSALLDALASMGEIEASLEVRSVRISQPCSGMVLRAVLDPGPGRCCWAKASRSRRPSSPDCERLPPVPLG